MNTISIFPVPVSGDSTLFHAVAGQKRSTGQTAGLALDALSVQLSADELRTLVVVQHMQPDDLFTAEQQTRLGELMDQWREARDGTATCSEEEQRELNRLIELELKASGERAKLIKDELEL